MFGNKFPQVDKLTEKKLTQTMDKAKKNGTVRETAEIAARLLDGGAGTRVLEELIFETLTRYMKAEDIISMLLDIFPLKLGSPVFAYVLCLFERGHAHHPVCEEIISRLGALLASNEPASTKSEATDAVLSALAGAFSARDMLALCVKCAPNADVLPELLNAVYARYQNRGVSVSDMFRLIIESKHMPALESIVFSELLKRHTISDLYFIYSEMRTQEILTNGAPPETDGWLSLQTAFARFPSVRASAAASANELLVKENILPFG